jgi:HK97 family phage major capsid protein
MNLKALLEKLNDNASKMEAIVNLIQEGKATDEDRATFDALEAESKQLREDIARIKNVANMTPLTPQEPTLSPEDKDVKLFADYVRASIRKLPIDEAITKGDNGDIIPQTIANKIIDKVKEISPLYRDAMAYSGKGKVLIPYVDEANDNIEADFVEEFAVDDAKATKLLTITLDEYLARAEVVVSKSLINNTDIGIVEFVVARIATRFAQLFEKAVLGQKTDKGVKGLSEVTADRVVTAASATSFTFDDLITLTSKLQTVYANDAYMVMSPTTLEAIRKLKDNNERYLLNEDVTGAFGRKILGVDVYTSDFASDNEIYYINAKEALAKHETENYSVQVLNEKFASGHAVEFLAFAEFDARVQNQMAVAKLVLKP